MEYRLLLNNLEELLFMNKGISVLNSRGNEKQLEITFQVTDATSRLLIHYGAEASNVRLDTWAHHSPSSEEGRIDPDRGLRYRYKTNIDNDDAIDSFCWLGAHLTWEMYRTGVIDSKNEKLYSKIFGAISKSA